MGEINKKNYDLAIEGAMEKCMQLAPAFNFHNMLHGNNVFNTRGNQPFDKLQFSNLDNLVSLWRTKRDTGLVNVDEDDFMEFLEDLGDFKADMAAKMGNLSCVLTEMKMLTPEMKTTLRSTQRTPLRSRDSTWRLLPWLRTPSGGRDWSPATRTATTSPSPSPRPPSTRTP